LSCLLYRRMWRINCLFRSGAKVTTASDNVASDLGLVEPRQVPRGEVHLNVGAFSENLSTRLVLCAERLPAMTWISLPLGLVGCDVSQEGDDIS
jgi:hypothetical protein